MNDDHERATCPKAGSFGHFMCGACSEHACSRFECGCILQLTGPIDGLGRATPEVARLALLFEQSHVTIGPRDAATKWWLENASGSVFVNMALSKLGATWMGCAIGRRDLRMMAAELQSHIQTRYAAHAQDHHWYHPPIRIEVRACEYMPAAPDHLELRELR